VSLVVQKLTPISGADQKQVISTTGSAGGVHADAVNGPTPAKAAAPVTPAAGADAKPAGTPAVGLLERAKGLFSHKP
jgi:hypothetical protein